MYDLIIIGMGISGISASIYAKRAGMKVLLLEGSAPGGTINKISEIENYPGIISISGPDLAYNLFEEVNKLNIEYKLERVTDVLLDETKTVKTTSNIYVAKYLLIASGRRPKMLGLKDEGYTTELRSELEQVKHKILDLFGDLYLTGVSPLNMRAQILVKEAGHAVHTKVANILKNKLVKI